ncbi:MAG TPA: hypothetical protein VNN20_17340 [Thermodesulfobacteriota bacterium]|nr:hypothetical protein [Thermodesulfobacteriota bacterium]
MLKQLVLTLLLILACLVPVGFLLWPFRETLNIYSSLIQAIATVVLVIVTAFYASMIWKQIKLMEKQVVCDIQIASASVYVDFSNQKFTFDLSLDVYNKNCASGSITLRNLILKYPDGSKETISQDFGFVRDKFLSHKTDNENTQVVFLKGGEIKNDLKLRYYPELNVCEKNNIRHVDFCVEYRDNLSNSYKEVKADKTLSHILQG